MEFIVLLLVILILLVVMNNKKVLTEQLKDVEHELRDLKSEIRKLNKPPTSIENIVVKEEPKPIIKEEPKPIVQEEPKPIVQEEKNYWKSGFAVVGENNNIDEQKNEIEVESIAAFTAPKATTTTLAKPTTIVERKQSFFEKNPDLEKFIGENLISKIGIAILVIAIGIFVKYAIDNNWIGPVGRVSIGLLCGTILIAIAHYLRKSYTSFSSILVGGGLAIFYFTISLAYHQFSLFNQTTAFIIMVVITGFAVLLSLLYNKQELAAIALLGGFGAPFMVSNGSGNYVTLFIYLILLNVGLLIIAYNKAWRLINQLAFVCTNLIFAGWLFTIDYSNVLAHQRAIVFASIFYVLFFAINIAHNIKENKQFLAADFSILLANTAIYFGFGIWCIEHTNNNDYKGFFSAGLALFNLVMSYLFLRNKKIDTNILYLLIGITLTLISLTAPLQLQGNYITLFWASEAVVIFWLFNKTGFKVLQIGALIVWIAMLLSLLIDVYDVYNYISNYFPIVFNKGFVTIVYTSIASYLLFILSKKSNQSITKPFVFRNTALAMFFAAGLLEIFSQFSHYYPNIAIDVLYVVLYCFVFAQVFILAAKKLQPTLITTNQILVLHGLCMLFYLFNIPTTYKVQTYMLEEKIYGLHFIAHWITVLLFANSIWQIIKLFKQLNNHQYFKPAIVLICILTVTFLSFELNLLVNQLFYSEKNDLALLQRVYIKSILPILWGICSFAFMWLGMKYKERFLRIISLCLFSITLFKLFAFDISNIPVAGKIAAFFCLGVLLLIVSFMYQKLKKIITQDEEKKAE
jgi:uncharacterized membrane protein